MKTQNRNTTLTTPVIGRNGFEYDATHVTGEFFRVGRHIVKVVKGRVKRNATKAETNQANHIEAMYS